MLGPIVFLTVYLVPGVLLGLFQLLATKSVTKWGALTVSIVPPLLLLFFAHGAFVQGKIEDEIMERGETSTAEGWLLLTWFCVNLPFLLASILITLKKPGLKKDD